MQNHNDAIRTSEDTSFRKIYLSLYWKGCVWEGIGDRTELQHIDLHSSGYDSVSFPFSWAAQSGSRRPSLSGTCSHSSIFSPTHLLSNCSIGVLRAPLLAAGFLYRIRSPTDWTSCPPSYIIIWHPLFFLRASQFCTQFNPSTVKVISWFSSTGCTCYLHGCISYFDSLAGSEVNIQHWIWY